MTNSWAIVIGINYYQRHPERRLKYAVQDAQLVYEFLCDYAQFPKDHVILCLGDEAHRDTSDYPLCSNLLGLLTQDLHPDRIGKVDRFWFFFSGHGVSRNGRDYLITSDSLIGDIDLRIALQLDEVIACLRQHQNAEIVLILDSCRQIVGSRDFGDSLGEETVKLAESRGITTIFSCDYGQFSHELDGKKHGSFTYAFIEGLKQHTLPNQLETYLQRCVPELNSQDGKSSRQTPRIRVDSVSRTYQPLLPECATRVDIEAIIQIATRAELEGDFEEAKSLWWKVIEVSHSEAQLIEARKVIERIAEKSSKAQSNLPMRSKEGKDGKKNQLEPIQTSIQALMDLNPDDWNKKSKDVKQSVWNKIARFLFEERDL